jgi:hypothetical protein
MIYPNEQQWQQCIKSNLHHIYRNRPDLCYALLSTRLYDNYEAPAVTEFSVWEYVRYLCTINLTKMSKIKPFD